MRKTEMKYMLGIIKKNLANSYTDGAMLDELEFKLPSNAYPIKQDLKK